jgi:hypothetical protein
MATKCFIICRHRVIISTGLPAMLSFLGAQISYIKRYCDHETIRSTKPWRIYEFSAFPNAKNCFSECHLCSSVFMCASLAPKRLDGLYSCLVKKSLSIKTGCLVNMNILDPKKNMGPFHGHQDTESRSKFRNLWRLSAGIKLRYVVYSAILNYCRGFRGL